MWNHSREQNEQGGKIKVKLTWCGDGVLDSDMVSWVDRLSRKWFNYEQPANYMPSTTLQVERVFKIWTVLTHGMYIHGIYIF